MDEVVIQVKPNGSSMTFSIAGTPGVVTIENSGTQICVQTKDEVDLQLVYTGTLDGIRMAETPAGVSSAPVLGETIGQDSTWKDSKGIGDFAIKREATGTIDVIDSSQPGTWYFCLRLDGTWHDPQIYNKGNQPPASG